MKCRQSNFELLRIVATLLVIIFHSDFLSLGKPQLTDLLNKPVATGTRILIESMSVICVNIFVLISGWFKIKYSFKGLCNYVFQCGYFLIGIYIICLMLGISTFSIHGILSSLCLSYSNWFLRAYLALYIISPILNTYLEYADKIVQKRVLIAFFIFQTIYGCSGAAEFIEYGYSTFSFIGLYLLGNYIKNSDLSTVSLSISGGGLVATIILNSILYSVGLYMNRNLFILIYGYINPLVIIGAVCLVLIFNKIDIKHSASINWVASSAFAAYLFHANPNIFLWFKRAVLFCYETYSGFICIMSIFIFIIFIFIVSVILDQPRKWIWRKIDNLL